MADRKLKTVFGIFLVVFCVRAAETGWAGRSGFHFLRSTAGITSSGRGTASAALSTDFARYTNPALYGGMEDPYLNMAFGNSGFGDNPTFAVEFLFPLRDYFFALTLRNTTIDDIFITGDLHTTDPQKKSLWQSSDFSLTAGVVRTPFFQWAVGFGGAFEEFDGYMAQAFIFNAGGQFFFLDRDLSLGLSALNMGRTTSFLDTNNTSGEGENLPTSFRTGISYDIDLSGFLLTPAFDVVYYHVYDPEKGIRENMADRIFYPLGIDIKPLEWMSVRMGKKINHDTDIISFGGDIQADFLKTSVAFTIQDYDGTRKVNWSAGVTFDIGTFTGIKETKTQENEENGDFDEQGDESSEIEIFTE